MNKLKKVFRCIFGRPDTGVRYMEPIRLPDASIIIDRTGIVTAVNKACCELLGYSESELVGKSASLFFVDNQTKGQEQNEIYLGKILDKLVIKGYVNNLEVIFLTKFKKKIPVIFNGLVLRDDSNNIIGVLGLARDIREIKRNTDKIKVLQKISFLTLDDREISFMMKDIGNYIKEFFDVDRATYYTIEKDYLKSVYASDHRERIILKIPEGIAGYSISIKKSYYTNDAYADAHFNRLIDSKSGYRTKNVLVCPVLEKHEVIGLVELINKSEDFTEQDKKDLEEMVNLAKYVIFDKQKDTKLKELAKFPEENPHLVMRATNKANIMYFNPAGKNFMKFFNCTVGDCLPDELRLPLIEAVNSAKHGNLEITVNDLIYRIHLVPLIKEGYVNLYGWDITKQKLAEKSLIASEERFRAVIENIGIGVSLISPDMKILLLNNQMKKWFPGVDAVKTPICYKAFNNPPREGICDYCPTFKTLKDGKIHEAITETPYGNRIFNYRVTASPVKDAGGNVIAAIEMVEDITERRKQEEQFKAIIQTSRDGFWIIDKQGHILDVNDSCCRMLGYSREEMLAMELADIEAVENQNDAENHIVKIKKAGYDFFETKHRCKDGSIIDVEISANYLKIVDCIFVFIHDITDRKRAEKELINSAEKYKTLFESTSSTILIVDVDNGIILDANKFAEKLLGRPREEIIGLNIMKIHPPKEYGEHEKQFRDNVKAGKVKFSEDVVIKKDGTRVPVQINATVTEIQGKKVIQGIFHDITEHKEAEKKSHQHYDMQTTLNYLLHFSLENMTLNEILNKTLDLILSISWMSFESRGCIFLTGENPDVLVLKAHKNLSRPIQNSCSRLAFGKCLCGKAASTQKIQFSSHLNELHEIRYEGIMPHGHYCIPILYADKTLGVINIYIPDGRHRDHEVETFLLTVADTLAGIIMRFKTETEKEKLQVQLFQQSKLAAVGELAAGLAHEIGNPLQTILGNVDLLLLENKSEELTAIKNASLQARKVIGNLMDFSRQKEMRYSVWNINGLLEKTFSLYGKQLELAKIKVEKHYQKDLPEINMSASHIEQVFLNLITNAQKSMPTGGTLTVTTTVCPEGNSSCIVISFKDTGTGILKENLGRLFEPFFTTRKEGTGLGLAVSYGIVKQHGGSIFVHSEGEGRGAEFIVKLPVNGGDKIS